METKIGSRLSIGEIKKTDFETTTMRETWSEMIDHAKNTRLVDILTIRTAIQNKVQSILIREGFIHPPIYLFSTCVDPLNHETESAEFSYYGQNCTLMQSLIFHKMAILSLTEIQNVFWVSPNVRKEIGTSDSKRYATEFTQIDFESSKLDMASCMALIEMIVTEVINELVENHKEIIINISGRELKPISSKLPVFDAVEEADVLGVEVNKIEKILALEQKTPFFITNLKREAYDRRDDITGKYLNFDICMPITGEILSGAEREFDSQKLKDRMIELDYPLDYFEPILKLAREVGLKPTTGAGFGLERWVRGILLLDDIAEIYPFKRQPEKPIIF